MSDLKTNSTSKIEELYILEVMKIQSVAPRLVDPFVTDVFMRLHTATFHQVLSIKLLFHVEWDDCLDLYYELYEND